MSNKDSDPDCRKCQYFHVTWDKVMPNGCKLYGIKGKINPAQIVRQSSGRGCLGFELKERLLQKKDPYGDE